LLPTTHPSADAPDPDDGWVVDFLVQNNAFFRD